MNEIKKREKKVKYVRNVENKKKERKKGRRCKLCSQLYCKGAYTSLSEKAVKETRTISLSP